MKTRTKMILLGSLYLSQGLPYGFFTQALPVLLRTQGLSLPKISLSSLLMLPWAFKFAWAPLIDAVRAPRFGRRRSVILPLQLASVLVLGLLGWASDPRALYALFAAVLVINVLSATQDIATDGLAVEVLDANERGLGNGLQVGAYRIGMIIGGGLLLWVFSLSGWTFAFLSLAGIFLIATAPIFLFREPEATHVQPPKLNLALLKKGFLRPGLLAWVPVLLTYKLGEWFASGMLRTFLTDMKVSMEELGTMLGIAGFTAGFLGAMTGGALTSYLGRKRALILFGLLQSLAIASFAYAARHPSMEAFYAVTLLEHFTSGMATATLFTAMMDFCRPEEAGTDYTVQACIVVIGSGAATALSGLSAEQFGYASHFLLAAVLSLLGVMLVFAYRPSRPEFTLLRREARR